MGITVTHEHSHTLYNLEKWEKWPAEYQNSYLRAHYYLNCRIIEMNAGKPPLTYKQFQRIIEGMEPPAKPVPTLTLQVTNWSYCTNSSITAPSWNIKLGSPYLGVSHLRDLMLSFSDAGQLHDAVARRPRREVRSAKSRRAWLWLWISETASLARRWDGGLVEAWETSWAQSMGRLLWPAKDDPTGDEIGF